MIAQRRHLMEIRLKAVKQKSFYQITDSTLGSIMHEDDKRFFPLFELIMKEIENEQINNKKGDQNYEN